MGTTVQWNTHLEKPLSKFVEEKVTPFLINRGLIESPSKFAVGKYAYFLLAKTVLEEMEREANPTPVTELNSYEGRIITLEEQVAELTQSFVVIKASINSLEGLEKSVNKLLNQLEQVQNAAELLTALEEKDNGRSKAVSQDRRGATSELEDKEDTTGQTTKGTAAAEN